MRSKPIAGFARANQGFPKFPQLERAISQTPKVTGYTIGGLTQMISFALLTFWIHGWDCVIRWRAIFSNMYADARILCNQQHMMDNGPLLRESHVKPLEVSGGQWICFLKNGLVCFFSLPGRHHSAGFWWEFPAFLSSEIKEWTSLKRLHRLQRSYLVLCN